MQDGMTNLVDQNNLLDDFRKITVDDDTGFSAFCHEESFAASWRISHGHFLNKDMHCCGKAKRITFLIF